MHPSNRWFIAAGLFLASTVVAAQVQQFPIGVGQSANGGGGGGGSTSPGGSSGQIQYNNSSAFGGFTASQDCTVNTTTGVVTCTKTNNVAFGAFATGTDAANLTGTVACARLPALTGGVTSSAGSCATASAAATFQGFSSGSGTYTVTVGTSWIEAYIIGAGGGGAGGSAGGNGGNGGNTCLNTSGAACTSPVYQGGGGIGGVSAGGGNAGTVSGSGSCNLPITGQKGGNAPTLSTDTPSGPGGNPPFGLGFGGPDSTGTGSSGNPGTGFGAGGSGAAFVTGTNFPGGGGGAGAGCFVIISAPAATYTYAIGAAGAAGTAAPGGGAGGVGTVGLIYFIEHK